MPKVEPGTFYRNGREYLTISEAARRYGLHPYDLYDAAKDDGLPLVTVAGCKCIAADELEKLQGGK